jgi:hypothetical protein
MNPQESTMIDRLFFAAFMFCLFAGTALAADATWRFVGRADVAVAHTPTNTRFVQLERVEVVGKRLAPSATLAQSERFDAPVQRAQ